MSISNRWRYKITLQYVIIKLMNRQILRLKNKKQKPNSVKILAFVGMSGSGKSTAVEFVKQKGFPHVYFGSVILQALCDANLEINEKNEKMMREKLRQDFGKDVVVNRMIEQMDNLINAGQRRILADGIYSWTEYKILKKRFPKELKVIALVPPKSERYKRISGRSERPLTQEETVTRDWAEVENLEKGGPIAMADYFIVNRGSVFETRRKIAKILREIEF